MSFLVAFEFIFTTYSQSQWGAIVSVEPRQGIVDVLLDPVHQIESDTGKLMLF